MEKERRAGGNVYMKGEPKEGKKKPEKKITRFYILDFAGMTKGFREDQRIR